MTTRVIRSIAELRETLASVREAKRTIGLVATMGALHAGHAKLIDTARRETDSVVASIFVNPIQFDRNGDYDRYPRDLASDVEFCTARRVDVIFAPSAKEMYPEPQRAFADVEAVSDHLCGEFRPGHFRGVATVVLKLLNIIQPARAYFGEKDAQQLAVIRRMVKDLNVPVAIVEVPTVRETDGFALSSRNQQLNAEERRIAPVLNQALRQSEGLISTGGRRADEIKTAALAILQQYSEIRVEYLEIVDPENMQPVEQITGSVRIMVAAWIGKTRLIDNILCRQAIQAAGR